MTNPIADISVWQGRAYPEYGTSGIDYPLLMSKTDGVIVRAGYGVTEDARYAESINALEQHPGILGAYWYVTDDMNGQWQAEAFIGVVKDGNIQPDFLIADCEDNSLGLSQAALRARYKLFLDTLAAEYPTVRLAIYTRASFWNLNVGVAGWEKNYRLWVAHYGTDTPAIPAAWYDWWLHQYSADGNGLGAEYGVISEDIDLNKLDVSPPAPPPPAAAPVPQLRVIANVLNVRSGPGTGYPIVDKRKKGDVVDAYGVAPISGVSVWARIDPAMERWAAITHPSWGVPRRYMEEV